MRVVAALRQLILGVDLGVNPPDPNQFVPDAMRFNDKELAEASLGPADFEGRLNHKRAHKLG